jgi:hypothetical protein
MPRYMKEPSKARGYGYSPQSSLRNVSKLPRRGRLTRSQGISNRTMWNLAVSELLTRSGVALDHELRANSTTITVRRKAPLKRRASALTSPPNYPSDLKVEAVLMDGTRCGLRPIYAVAGKVGLMDACIPEPAALDQPWRPNSVATIGSRSVPPRPFRSQFDYQPASARAFPRPSHRREAAPLVRQRTRGPSPKARPARQRSNTTHTDRWRPGPKTAAAEADASSEPDPAGVAQFQGGAGRGDRGRRPDRSGPRLSGWHFWPATGACAGGENVCDGYAKRPRRDGVEGNEDRSGDRLGRV